MIPVPVRIVSQKEFMRLWKYTKEHEESLILANRGWCSLYLEETREFIVVAPDAPPSFVLDKKRKV